MWEKQSTLIRASAGSGKTYQLSLRYLALMALGESPREIIALTFTRKAAAEFTDRILRMLAEGASSDAAAVALAEKIRRTWFGLRAADGKWQQPGLLAPGAEDGLLPRLGRERFLELLRVLADDLGRLHLSTLDSFFGNMAQSLSLEMGIGGLTMMDGAGKEVIQKEVLLELFEKTMEKSEGREEFMNAYRLSTLTRENDRTEETLLEFVNRYHERFRKMPLERQWGALPLIYGSGYPWTGPSLKPEEFFGRAERIKGILMQSDNSDAWKKERCSFLDSLSEYGRTGKVPKSPTAYKPDSPFWEGVERGTYVELYRKKEIDLGSEAGAGIAGLIRDWVKWEIVAASGQTRGIYSLMALYDELYGASVRARGLFTFDDVVRLLLSSGEEAEDREQGRLRQALNDIRFRMDGWFRHWMLDEFQDTSRDQWNIVSPLMREVAMDTSQERSLFIVGDPKQSIYQWRGGEPRLFDDLGNDALWAARLKKWEMDVSYRSSQTVLDFANKACRFDQTAANARPEALERWAYSDHAAGGANGELSGHVQVWTLSRSRSLGSPDEENASAGGKTILPALTALLKRVQPLERGLSCAVMVGRNRDAEIITGWLRSAAGGGFAAEMDSEAAIGEDSPVGAALADFFRWLQHPGDLFAWNHVILSPLGSWLSPENGGGDEWRKWSELLENRGLGGVMHRWRSLLLSGDQLSLNAFQQDRLNAWVRAAEEYDRKGGDPSEWVSVMENMRRREHSAAGAVQVMTWYKAKGLEFDMVVLPDIKTTSFADKGHMDVIERLDSQGIPVAFIQKPAQSTYEYDVALGGLVEDWAARQEYEGFCKLYVALTRAKRATYVFLPPPPRDEAGNCSAASILYTACGDTYAGDEDNLEGMAESCLYERGQRDWYSEHERQKTQSAHEEETVFGKSVDRT